MQTILVVLHLFLAIGLVGLVLMQHGRGADAGAAFGSGASGTVFGASGAANFLSRATAAIATLFFVTSLALGYFSMQAVERPGLMDGERAPLAPPVSEVPLVPGQQSESPVPAVDAGGDSAVPAVPVPASETTPPAVSEEVPAIPAAGGEPPVPATQSEAENGVPKPGQ